MLLFDLSPVPTHKSHSDWAASTHFHRCYVAARDERRARIYAANAFEAIEAPRSASGLRPASPWVCRTLVSAAPVLSPSFREVREGMIFVPADPHEPSDDHHVMRRVQ